MSTLDRTLEALAGDPWRSLARPLMRRRATVFMLHRETNAALGVRGHTQDEVRTAVRRLRAAGSRFVSLRALVAHGRAHGTFPADAVAFTIDDGFADHAHLARILRAEGVPVTVFLITGLLDGAGWPWDDRVAWALRSSPGVAAHVTLPDGDWQHALATPGDRHAATASLQERLKRLPQDDLESTLQVVFRELGVAVPKEPPAAFRPMDWSTARDLEREGVEFGPHSVTHRIFSRLGEAEARRELAESWRRLREELVHPLDVFAWPTGRTSDFTARDCRLARDLGLGAAVATADDYACIDASAGEDGWYGLRRYALPASPRHLLQYGSWIERAKQLARAPLGRMTAG